jgi:tetratricopeptide (TPR) repeat protein
MKLDRLRFLLAVVLVNPYQVGDIAFQNRANSDEAQKALSTYREFYKKNPQDFESGWRLSMACYFVGLRLGKTSDEREALYEEGKAAGLASIAQNPKCAPCHFWTAINMALYGESVGAFKMLFSLADIRDHLQQSLQADPSYAFGGAYRLLGLIEHKLPGILGGSNDEAKRYFEKAIQAAPEEPMNHLFLAELYLDKFNDSKQALVEAKKGVRISVPDAHRLESLEAQTKLRHLVTTLELR